MLDCVLALLAYASCASGKIMLQCLFIFQKGESNPRLSRALSSEVI